MKGSSIKTNEGSTKIVAESDNGQDEDEKEKIENVKVKKPKKGKKGKQKKLIMNITNTKYYVVRYVGKQIYKMRLTHSEEEDWDICW